MFRASRNRRYMATVFDEADVVAIADNLRWPISADIIFQSSRLMRLYRRRLAMK